MVSEGGFVGKLIVAAAIDGIKRLTFVGFPDSLVRQDTHSYRLLSWCNSKNSKISASVGWESIAPAFWVVKAPAAAA
jgi:hypothetical protein